MHFFNAHGNPNDDIPTLLRRYRNQKPSKVEAKRRWKRAKRAAANPDARQNEMRPLGLDLRGIITYEMGRTQRREDGCLFSTHASNNPRGSVQVYYRDRKVLLHRLVMLARNGPAPLDKPLVRHLCGNGGCVDPAHLEYGDTAANQGDMAVHVHVRGPAAVPICREVEALIRKRVDKGTYRVMQFRRRI